jgi:hypothetical protein
MQITKVEENPFTSSLYTVYVRKPAVEKRGGDGRSNAPLHPTFPVDPWIYHLKTTYPLFSSSVFPSWGHGLKNELQFWLCAGKWLVPPKPSAKKPFWQKMGEMLPHHFTANYWRNNREVATLIDHM